jgi:hypothetical protein
VAKSCRKWCVAGQLLLASFDHATGHQAQPRLAARTPPAGWPKLTSPPIPCLPQSPLLPQILICQNLRNNLQHPNEYIRGVTLRFLCRIKEEEILEPLVPSILANLEHRHSYVRRNAVLAINSLYK